ncbi:MAG TPA: protein tlpB [Flavobacterium sp.]|nr:protein tlpB [Flavobacterium sp.]
MNKYAFSWIIRLILSALFIVSAVAKLYPSPYFAISTFEVKQLYPLGFSEQIATYFSRFLIGVELAIGFLFLMPVKIRKVIIPVSIFLLTVFTLHLTYETFKTGGNLGNCGCFGSLIPMTPIEAIIKNIIAILLLIWLLNLKIPDTSKNLLWFTTSMTLASILLIFMLAPIRPIETLKEDDVLTKITPAVPNVADSIFNANNTENEESKTDTLKKQINDKAVIDEPRPIKSGLTKYFADIDQSKKILCFFAPGCDHCQETAKELSLMKKRNVNFPEIRIIFMNEEAFKIPDFFKIAGANYPYKVIEIIPFWNELGNNKNTPGVLCLWNGNKIKMYDGIDNNQFNPTELEKIVQLPYSKLK